MLIYSVRFLIFNPGKYPRRLSKPAHRCRNASGRSHLTASGIGYALTQWPRLIHYIEHGILEGDNNLIENLVRPLALGRRNYLFAGSHNGARRAAMIYSLIATAKEHDVEPFAYLKDVLARIADHSFKQRHQLLPHTWQPGK